MSSITKKITNRIKNEVKSAENYLHGTIISFSASYNNINHPGINKDFTNKLYSDSSLFIKLLDLNKNAVHDSQKILNNRLRVFRNEIEIKSDNDFWHKDFFSGFTYKLIPYTKLKFKNNTGADPIVPWELSRLQFIPTLIQAHRESGDIKIFNFFILVLDDWIEKNPYLYGINWKCSMDVGIRSINIGLGIFYFWELIPDKKKTLYLKVLWAHAKYILKHESFKSNYINKTRHNHFLVSTISLLFLSLSFKGAETSECLKETFTELKKEILNQFNKDGVNFEGANHYHQFTLEAVMLAEIFLASYKEKDFSLFSDLKCKERIEKAVKFVSDYMTTNTISPQFGDSSDGRILFFKDYFDWNPRDHNYLFEIRNLVISEEKLSENGVDIFYKDSGYAFYKNDKYGLSINCSGISEFKSGHNHLDKASFVLQVHNSPLFVDPGTYCYTSDSNKRNQYRQTRAHNTIIVDKKEQVNFSKRGAFTSLGKINCKIERKENTGIFILSHNGFMDTQIPVLIKRVINCLNDKIVFEETVEGVGDHLVEIIYNLHPKIQFELNDNVLKFSIYKKELCAIEFDKILSFSVEDYFYSPSYKEESIAKKIVLSKKIALPTKFFNTIYIR